VDCGWAEEAGEKGQQTVRVFEKHSSGAEARVLFSFHPARLKSNARDKSLAYRTSEFFRSL
jgi:hypothetical protein